MHSMSHRGQVSVLSMHEAGQYIAAAETTLHPLGQLPLPMAAIPEAVEGMQLSQRFSGAAQQLQADMNALRMSLGALDFGMHFT